MHYVFVNPWGWRRCWRDVWHVQLSAEVLDFHLSAAVIHAVNPLIGAAIIFGWVTNIHLTVVEDRVSALGDGWTHRDVGVADVIANAGKVLVGGRRSVVLVQLLVH